MPTTVQHVMIVVAMEQEIAPLIQRFDLQPVDSCFLAGAPFVAWVGSVDGLTVHAIWCGRDPRFGNVNNVATTAAAVATYAAIAAFGAPDLLLSAGTAGGFAARGARVGDVFLSTKSIFHSRRIPSGDDGRLEEYGFGHYRSPPLSGLAARAGLKLGVISTSDSLDTVPMDLELMRGEGAAVKEMEAAAVAWVCSALGVPFVAVKAITDIVDGPHATRGEFEANLEMASAALQAKVALLLTSIANTELRNWALGGSGEASAQSTASTETSHQPSPANVDPTPINPQLVAMLRRQASSNVSEARGSGRSSWFAGIGGALAGATVVIAAMHMLRR